MVVVDFDMEPSVTVLNHVCKELTFIFAANSYFTPQKKERKWMHLRDLHFQLNFHGNATGSDDDDGGGDDGDVDER